MLNLEKKTMTKPAAADESLVCTFCDMRFTPGPDYPKDWNGNHKAFILTIGLLYQDHYNADIYSGIHDERAICGPMCPRCRQIVDGFFLKKGLRDEKNTLEAKA